jgi:hypothetical protein
MMRNGDVRVVQLYRKLRSATVGALTVIDTVRQTFAPARSTAQTLRFLWPATLGVPLRIPFKPSVSPVGGKSPPLSS